MSRARAASLLLLVLPAAATLVAPARALQDLDEPAIEREVFAVLDAFMTAFNALDMEAWEATFHFPHFRFAGAGMTVLERPGLQDGQELGRRLRASGWHHSGWARREIVHLSRDKVHVDTRFTRYRDDGTVLAAFDSLYVLTREDGRWGIKLRSSFAP